MAFSFGNTGGGGAEKKTGTLFGSTTGPPGGLFSQSQQQPQQANTTQSGLFGSIQQQPQQQGLSTGLFAQSQQQQQPQQAASSSLFGSSQQQQPSNMGNSLFGASLQPAPALSNLQAQSMQQQREGLPQLRQSSTQPYAASSINGHREKSVVEQIRVLNNKWDPDSPECVFQHYFYNSVKPEEAPFYGPSQGEDERKWEEALSKKPSPGAIPVLARGFDQVAERIRKQSAAVTALRMRLHEINNSLSLLKDTHELSIASRITESKRKHIIFTQRTLSLATKVQILRNRGYVMDQQEEDLKKKLFELEKKAFDPVLGGRQEEIWARMSGVRERARILQAETERLGKTIESQQSGEFLTEEDQKALEKLLKDYDRQLEHLKKWVEDTKEEYDEWETTKQAKLTKR